MGRRDIFRRYGDGFGKGDQIGFSRTLAWFRVFCEAANQTSGIHPYGAQLR
jgi:hypothetical protein